MAMSKEELKSRIEKCDEKIIKIQKRIDKWSKGMRPEAVELCKKFENVDYNSPEYKAIFADWKNYKGTYSNSPDVYNQDDWNKGPNFDELRSAYSDLRDVRSTKNKYEVKLMEINNFENEEKIPVLVEFLDQWEEKAREYYLDNCKLYFELERDYDDAYEKWAEEQVRDERGNISRWDKERFKQDYYSQIDNFTKTITRIKRKYFYPDPNDTWNYKYIPDSYSVDEELLDKTLKEEKKAKYKDLVQRITAVVGNIQDVSNLKIAATGQLNGIVKGDKASAKVETIGAGGYNVQVFHYRTLVHKI